MNKINALILPTFFLMLFSTNLYAADLINADEVSYTIFIDLDDTSKTIVIAPKQTISDICTDCYIEIDGDPDGVSIDDQAKVIIKDGKLTIED